jgi:hypothetical protein
LVDVFSVAPVGKARTVRFECRALEGNGRLRGEFGAGGIAFVRGVYAGGRFGSVVRSSLTSGLQ